MVAAEDELSSRDLAMDPFAPLVGQVANGCWLGYGPTLFLEFGERQDAEDLKNHKSGEWSLQCGAILWRVEQGDQVLAGSEDDRPEMEAAINRLNGLVLLSGKICQWTGDSIITFNDGVVLRTFVLTTEDDPRWSLRHGVGEFAPLGAKLPMNSESSFPSEKIAAS